jgi:putative FmdB family regulatory protein
MPLYEYMCRKCSRRFEALVMGSSQAACPGCGSSLLEQQLSVFAVGAGAAKSSSSARSAKSVAPCGSCGDPRGPGSCDMD